MISSTTLLWFRQDLRLLDNPALVAAVADGRPVVALYVLPDAAGPWTMGGASKWWLHGGLAALAAALAAKGCTLILRRGDPAAVVPAVAREVAAVRVHAGICPEPAWRAADAAVAARGIELVLHQSFTLFDAEQIRTRAGGIYGMFTPFANAVRAMHPPPAPLPEPDRIAGPAKLPRSDRLEDWQLLPTRPDWAGGLRAAWVPGEAAARARGRTFLRDAVRGYDSGRNLPGRDLTSALSPHLHFGEISPRTLWHALHRRTPSAGEQVF